jgi:hypothetical protein
MKKLRISYVGIVIVKKFFGLLIVVGCLWIGVQHVRGSRLQEILVNDSFSLSLSLNERELLESFFTQLIIHDSAGYTLLGDKPLSYQAFLRPTLKWDIFFLLEAFSPSNLRKYRAWKIWEKYARFFPGENFLIWSEPSPWTEGVEFIVIANRDAFCRVVRENRNDFQAVLSQEIVSGEDLLKEVKDKSLFKDILQSHEGLMGVLLGYGHGNAWLFWERSGETKDCCTGIFKEENERLFQSRNVALNFTFGWPRVDLSEALVYPSFLADQRTEETKTLKN